MGLVNKKSGKPPCKDMHKNFEKLFFQDITSQNISSGLISSTLVMTGPAVLILQAAATGHFTDQQTINWIFAVYVFGGLFGIVMPLLYRMPITGAHSISGVAFLATVTAHFTYPELIGGYVISGLLILLTGLSGLFTKIIKCVPKEVIAAMLAGLVTSYVVQIVSDIKTLPWVGGSALVSFFIATKLLKRIPPVMIAVVVAFIALFFTQHLTLTSKEIGFFLPSIQKPEFTWMGMVTLALPLAMLVLSNDVAPGIGALESSGFEPPITKLFLQVVFFQLLQAFWEGNVRISLV